MSLKRYQCLVALAVLSGVVELECQASTIGYTGVVNLGPGGTITLSPDYTVTSADNVVLVGASGTTTGAYQIETVTGDTAPVTGTGTLNLFDGDGGTLTGTLDLEDITLESASSDLGAFNFSGAINVTGVTYNGNVPAFQALVGSGSGIGVFSFFLSGPENLDSLKRNGGTALFVATYSDVPAATVTSSPEPSSGFAMLAGAAGLLWWYRRFKLSRA